MFTLALAFPQSSSTQDTDAVARLRARVAQAPTDASLHCQLAFALVGAGASTEAEQEATRGIAAITRPLTAATRRTMAACLYNHGRALEAPTQPQAAVSDYVASLLLRDNASVRARLDTLVPNVPQDAPAAALAVFAPPAYAGHPAELVANQTVVSARAGGVTWRFVTARLSGTLIVYATTVSADGHVSLAAIDEWSQEDFDGPIEVTSARAHAPLSALSGVIVEAHAEGGGSCARMDGFADFHHDATMFVGLVDGVVRSDDIVTEQHDCEGVVRTSFRVRGADVQITRAHGGNHAVGTFPIASLLH